MIRAAATPEQMNKSSMLTSNQTLAAAPPLHLVAIAQPIDRPYLKGGAIAGRRIPRPRPTLAQLGLNRLGMFLVALNALVIVTDIALYTSSGLSIQWATVVMGELCLGLTFAVWLNFYCVPGGSKEWFVAELMFVVSLMVFLTNVGSPMQYGAVALGAPYADPWLAAADAALGIHVPALAAWTFAHPLISVLLKVSYFSLLPQFVLTIVVFAAFRDREGLWEFAFHIHVCVIATVAALMVWPAVCPPEYYGFRPTIDMTHLIQQIQRLHQGTMKVVRFDELEGLVSFPSFHVAGALIVMWAARRRRWLLMPLACWNLVLIASTFMTGVHYVTDVIASVPLVLGSVALYRRYCQRWLVS
jgi:membrane-associated phospholipid phosphatase